MRLVYFGSGAFGLPTLERLAGEHDLAAVVTQPDRPAGRRRSLTPTPVAQWVAAESPATPLLKPDRVDEPAVVRKIRGLRAEVWVVIAFGQKLGRGLLEDRFAINLHASLLPRWRGAAPIHHAILAGDEEIGVSVITLADRLDAGDILAQDSRPLDPALTAGELHDTLSLSGPACVESVLGDFERDTLQRRAQDESRVTLAPKLSRADAWVDLTQPAEACRRRIHGLTPWPGVSVGIAGEPVRVLRVQPERTKSDESPGTLIEPDAGLVMCADGTALRLLDVQPAGGRPMPWDAFLRGHALRPGAIIEGSVRH